MLLQLFGAGVEEEHHCVFLAAGVAGLVVQIGAAGELEEFHSDSEGVLLEEANKDLSGIFVVAGIGIVSVPAEKLALADLVVAAAGDLHSLEGGGLLIQPLVEHAGNNS